MCGRYSLTRDELEFQSRFAEQPLLIRFESREEIAPTELAPVIRLEAGRAVCRSLRWGWTGWKRPLINARMESLGRKPMFRESYRARRCLVPADGFYEWQKEGKQKHRVRFALADGSPFFFAGLWNAEESAPGGGVFTILTAPADRVVAPVHDRMPVILGPEQCDRWLDPGMDSASLGSLLAAECREPLVAFGLRQPAQVEFDFDFSCAGPK